MVRLFEEACRDLLSVGPAQRQLWLESRTQGSAEAVALLVPVVERFQGQVVDELGPALKWCRQHVVQISA
jgi:hypothetical protein